MTRREAIYVALEKLQHHDRLLVLETCAAGPTSPKMICNLLADEAGILVDDSDPELRKETSEARRDWIKGRLGSIAYHTRTALDNGLIKKHSQRQVRGALEHLYVTSAAGRRLLDSLDLDGQ
jgi:hypothetical protein